MCKKRKNPDRTRNRARAESKKSSALRVQYPDPPSLVNDDLVCRTCGYFHEVPAKVRARRFCAWTGEKLSTDSRISDCHGYHAGKWGALWE